MCILAAGGPVLERLGRLATAWAASLLPGPPRYCLGRLATAWSVPRPGRGSPPGEANRVLVAVRARVVLRQGFPALGAGAPYRERLLPAPGGGGLGPDALHGRSEERRVGKE